MIGDFMANGKRNIIRTRDYAMVRIIQGVTKSGPHKSRKAYNRQESNKADCLEDYGIESEDGGPAYASGSIQSDG